MSAEPWSLPPRAEMLRAMLESDASYEGVFFTAVRTTRIFCRPSCSARKPKPENVDFFRAPSDAMAAGYRPCLRCKPLQLAATAPAWIKELLDEVEGAPVRRLTDADLAGRGIDPTALRRWFKQSFGMTFHAFLRARALGTALDTLRRPGGIDQAAFDLGYESLSGFRHAFGKTFATTPGRAAEQTLLAFDRVATPLGPMIAMAEARGLVLLEFLDRPALVAEIAELRERHGYVVAPGKSPHLEQVAEELGEYFAGRLQELRVPLHTPGSAFELSVWNDLRAIPFGATTTYGEIAERLGRPGAARAVGRANGRNRVAIVVPCHRVIGADGSLVGYGGGKARKAHLLSLERKALQMAEALPEPRRRHAG